MKKIIVILALLAVTLVQAQPDKKGDRGERLKNISPQEMATLQSKKMTIALDLSDQQEQEVYQILLSNAKKRIANKKSREEEAPLTEEQKKAQKVEMIDEKIATKRAMKEILSDEQYEKWEKLMRKRSQHRKRGKEKKKNRY